MRSPSVEVCIDLDRVRASAESIRRRTGVRLIAVIKADAYGLGAAQVADVLAGVADEFAYFSINEARAVGRSGLVMGPPEGDPAEYRALRVRPAVGAIAAAEKFKGLPVAINVDVSMQRFGCPLDRVAELARHCDVSEYFCHAVTMDAVARLRAGCGGRGKPIHAAATDLLDRPEAWLNAVRPGLALYRGAVRVRTRLHTVRETDGPVGYGRFRHSPVGIILAGYSSFLRPGPVRTNGRHQQVIETGMNTSFVTVDPADKAGDEVVLLGDGLTEAELAAHFGTREHEILCRYTAMGPRQYVTGG